MTTAPLLGTGREISIDTPFDASTALNLAAGDVVYLTGIVLTARDAAHHKLMDSSSVLPASITRALAHGVVYHCGPVATLAPSGTWEIKAAGPTTSARMNRLETGLMERHDIHCIIGKGGMQGIDWPRLKACYLAFIGGAALIAKQAITRIVDVAWIDDIGIPEAAWVLEVRKFGPLIVAQDARGNDLYGDVSNRARSRSGKFH